MKYYPKDIVLIVERFIGDECDLREWDDLISIRHSDIETEEWVEKIRKIEEHFGNTSEGVLITDEGIARLRDLILQMKEHYRSELR